MTTDPGSPKKAPEPAIGIGLGLDRMLGLLHRVEDLLIATLLTGTMGLALFQIFLRNVMGTGIVWGDVLIRILVLWLGMAGAMAATREHKHISIDLLTRFLAPGLRRAAAIMTTFFAAVVSGVAGYVSLRFVLSEYAAGDLAFGKVPYWLCEAILPLGFAVIALRYAIQFGIRLRGLSGGTS
jgi:TRAP-type C4-dicarboxylate transport system permease small subunit